MVSQRRREKIKRLLSKPVSSLFRSGPPSLRHLRARGGRERGGRGAPDANGSAALK